jgi:hypothetical protein
MTVTHREIISIVQVVVYSPILLASAILVLRYGLGRDTGWIYISLFSIGKCFSFFFFVENSNGFTLACCL